MTGPQYRRQTWMVCSLLAVGTLALYWPVHGFEFVDYDDPDYLLRVPEVQGGLSWWGLVWSVVDAHAANWHPLTWLSHMLDCQWFGLHAGAHHLVNALLHAANGALLFLALRKLTGAHWRSALVAALFVWHPLRVESVAWISERKDVLSGLFFMLTLWGYANFAEQSKVQSPNSKLWLRASLSFFVLGLLSKPMLVTLPGVLLLLDFWPLRRLQNVAPRKLLVEKIPFFLWSAAFSVIAFLAQRQGGAVIPLKSLGVAARGEFVLTNCLGYLEKIFWPSDLAFLYLRPPGAPASAVALAAAVLTAVSVFALVNFRRRPYLITGWLWFLGMLLPVSGLVQVGLQSIADRYTYLPAIGICLMLAWGGHELCAALFPERPRKIVSGVVAAGVLAVCVLLSRQQLTYWRNTQTLMEHALALDPNNYVAHSNLGVYFSRHGRTREALFHYRCSLELDPATAGLEKRP
jgi:hypothetical protein